MVRIARREPVVPQPRSIADAENVVVVAGCNTDALYGLRVPASCRCIAADCAMWRFADTTPEHRNPKLWWAEEDEPATEPPRPERVPASAEWVPYEAVDDGFDGGYWLESAEALSAEIAKAAAARRGFCGLAGKPVV
jgi:hypothetical protein